MLLFLALYCYNVRPRITSLGGGFKLIFRNRYHIGKVSRSSPRSVGARFQSRKNTKRRIGSWVFRLAMFGIVMGLIGGGILGGLIWHLSGKLPNVESINTYIPAETTKIYSQDGVVLAELHREENRSLIPIERISPLLQQSVIAMEDARFYEHRGLDFRAIMRALVKDIKARSFVEGGSTLTQQLAKNIFLSPQKKLMRKLSEAILAVQIERKYTKTEILELYLNQVYWGHNSYGIESASKLYFGKKAKDLTLAESALLVGMLKGPELYSPFKNMSGAKKRQKLVLNRMVATGLITQAESSDAYTEEIALVERKRFRYKAPYFTTHVIQQLIDMYGEEVAYTSGLKVFTSLKYKMQQKAEEVVQKYIDVAKKPNWVGGQKVPSLNYNQAAILAMDPKSGEIWAMQGGNDFLENEFNRTTQAMRQPGSSFKPFVYLTALEKGFSPGTYVDDSPVTFNTIEGPYSPGNYTQKFLGPISIRRALQKSVNIVAIKLNHLIGPKQVVSTAKKLGIKSPLRPVLSLPLGANEANMLEMVSAYGVLANEGRRFEPVSILRIEDRDGLLLYEHRPVEKKVYDSNLIASLVEIMEGVVKYGTGKNARLPRPVAGKTGTTSDYRDAWFVGFIPQLVVGSWVGNDDNTSMAKITGGGIPAVMWREFMTTAIQNIPAKSFKKPRGLVTKTLNKDNGRLANAFTPKESEVKEKFWRGSEPTDVDGPQYQKGSGSSSSDSDVLEFFQ